MLRLTCTVVTTLAPVVGVHQPDAGLNNIAVIFLLSRIENKVLDCEKIPNKLPKNVSIFLNHGRDDEKYHLQTLSLYGQKLTRAIVREIGSGCHQLNNDLLVVKGYKVIMKIKAYAVKKKGGNAESFSYERTLGKNDVLVRITHCSITRGDIQLINNEWGDAKFPLVPGHEIIGIIEETAIDVIDLKHGDRVGIGYQQEACFECQFCREGNEQFCPKQKVIAVDCFGGLAQHIIVDGRFVFKLPPELDSVKSAPLMSSGLTVYSAIVSAKLPNNSTVGVLGVGGLGSLALQFFHKMGHKISAFSHSPTKKEISDKLGAEFVDSSNPNDLARHHRKYDFIISTLNADFELDTYLKMLKPQGKFCLVAQPLNKLAMSAGLLYDYAQRTIYGHYTGSRKDMVDMLDFSAKHNIESIVEVMPFSKMNEALEMVRTGKGPLRLVLENSK